MHKFRNYSPTETLSMSRIEMTIQLQRLATEQGLSYRESALLLLAVQYGVISLTVGR